MSRHSSTAPVGSVVGRLSTVLSQSWSLETSYDPAGWSKHNCAWGQCAVSALIAQDLLGGDLLVGRVNGIEHYWNELPDGRQLDLTKQQFGQIASLEQPSRVTREYVLSFPDTRRRYERLRREVLERMQIKASPTTAGGPK
jgi:hypothetical protein